MATYLDGNVRKATANTVTAMKRSAKARQCPKCGRKSALVQVDDMTVCKWSAEGKCDYVRLPTRQYADWWTAQGKPIPDGNRAAAVEVLVNVCAQDRTAARFAVARTAHFVEADEPEAALKCLRALLGEDETSVLMVAAHLCCPPESP